MGAQSGELGMAGQLVAAAADMMGDGAAEPAVAPCMFEDDENTDYFSLLGG